MAKRIVGCVTGAAVIVGAQRCRAAASEPADLEICATAQPEVPHNEYDARPARLVAEPV